MRALPGTSRISRTTVDCCATLLTAITRVMTGPRNT